MHLPIHLPMHLRPTRLLTLLALILGLQLSLIGQAYADTSIDEGIDYKVIDNPKPYSGPGIKVEEFFWYGCPHCFHFEPHLKKWLKAAGDDINFERIPAPLNRSWVIHARAYYAAQLQGVADKAHQALFNAIHVDHKAVNDRNSLAAFYAAHGADAGQFKSDLGSFGVDIQVRKAALLLRRYGIQSVPNIVINGKYLITPLESGGSFERMVAVMDHVIAKVRADQAQTNGAQTNK